MKKIVFATTIVLVMTAAVEGAWLWTNREGSSFAVSKIVASRVDISHDFTNCSIRFANEGNSTDTTRSALIFYVGAWTGDTIVRNADPPPTLTVVSGATADWDCSSSFAGSPPGIKGQAVHVVISAVISRERDSVGSFT